MESELKMIFRFLTFFMAVHPCIMHTPRGYESFAQATLRLGKAMKEESAIFSF